MERNSGLEINQNVLNVLVWCSAAHPKQKIADYRQTFPYFASSNCCNMGQVVINDFTEQVLAHLTLKIAPFFFWINSHEFAVTVSLPTHGLGF